MLSIAYLTVANGVQAGEGDSWRAAAAARQKAN
jgi:hypothetical protein